MRISGSPVPIPPAAISHARGSERAAGTADPADIPPAAANSDKTHGPVGAAAHSHRSDVAALRQWINHSELRSDLPLPDLTADHKGNGFRRAVAAYEAVMATTAPAPAPVTDPTPAADQLPVGDPTPAAASSQGIDPAG